MFFKNKKNAAVLAEKLRQSEERLHIWKIKVDEAHNIAAAELNFELFINLAESVTGAFKMTCNLLKYRYKNVKITMVYTFANDFYVFDSENPERGESFYPHHAEVTSLISGKKFVFLNGFALKEQNAGFAGENARLVCVVPLNGGYMILESDDEETLPVVREEEYLLTVAGLLSECIASVKNNKISKPEPVTDETISEPEIVSEPDSDDIFSALRKIDGLELDSAIETMGGLEDVYEKSVRMFIRLTPENAGKMDGLLTDDLKSFAIEIHGMKGSLNNIGAYSLGSRAAEIEASAKSGGADACRESYPPFRESLMLFHNALKTALPGEEAAEQEHGDMTALSESLIKAKEAVDDFDAYAAAEIMRNAGGYSYGEETDALIKEAVALLENFDPESAGSIIDKLINNIK